MENYAAPSSYIKDKHRAHAIAAAEAPFRDALHAHEVIQRHFWSILDSLKQESPDYDETEELVKPVDYGYLIDLFNEDTAIGEDVVHYAIQRLFIQFMEDYGYDSKQLVPSIPLGYLLHCLAIYDRALTEYMASESEVAEREYIASMN